MRKLLLSLTALLTTVGAWAHDFTRLTSEQLNAATQPMRIAIECSQESNYDQFYTGTQNRKTLPLDESVIFEWVPAGDGKFYIKKVFAADASAYLQNKNITTFGAVDAATVAKFTAVTPTESGSGVTKFLGANCHYTKEEDKVYWVRLSLGETWFNFNGNQYNKGEGVWTVQNVVDLSDYYKLTLKLTKDGNETTTVSFMKVGETIVVPDYSAEGYTHNYVETTKTASDEQVIEVVYDANYKNLLQAMIDKVNAIEAGENIGDFTSTSVADLKAAIEEAEAKISSDNVEPADLEALQAAIDALDQVLPATQKFYRLKSKSNGKFITVPSDYNTGQAMIFAEERTKDNIIYLTEDNKILCYATGMYVNYVNHAHLGYAGTYTFEASKNLTAGALSIFNGSVYLSAADKLAATENAAVLSCDWIVEEVDELPVAMDETIGYATIYAPVALNTSGMCEAYTGVVAGDYLSMTRIDAEDGVIPARTPVVLKYVSGTENGMIHLPVVTSEKDAPEVNDLQGTFARTKVEGPAYVLSKLPEQEVGFYRATLNHDSNTKFMNNAFKVYVLAPSAPLETLKFNFGGITAIDSVSVGFDVNAPVFDLMGRRVNTISKGVFVQDGKKFIVK